MAKQNSSPNDLSLAQRLYQGDPLLLWLRDRRRISYPAWIVIFALFGFSLLLFLPVLTGAPSMDSRAIATSALQGLVIMPLGFALYLVMPDFIAGLFDSLKKGGVIGNPIEQGGMEYPDFLDDMVAKVNKWWWIALAILLVMLYWYFRLGVQFASDLTSEIPVQYRLWVRLAYLLLYTPLIYGALLSLVRFLVGLLYSQRLFRQFKFQVNPLNPDGAGGLSHVGKMLVISVMVAVLLGAAAAGMIIFSASPVTVFTRPETVALFIVYIVFTPLLFAVWLWAPHQALLAARQEAMQPLAEEYMSAVAQAKPTPGESADDIKAKTERLIEIKRQYDLVRDTYPIWPVPDQTLKRLVATSSLPAISPLISGLLVRLGEYLLKLFGPQ